MSTHDLEIALRPHIKTHKSPVLAREQLRRGTAGLTCAMPYEAEVMSEVCDDLLVMYPPVGSRRAAPCACWWRSTPACTASACRHRRMPRRSAS